MADNNSEKLNWCKVAGIGDVAEGRVKSVHAQGVTLALVRFNGQYAAMENKCPHQGGPLGEGSIERGEGDQCWLRCPWHGWDFDPLTGRPPGGHEDSGQKMYPVEARSDGIYVGIEPEAKAQETISDVMVKTMVNWGVTHVFGMVGHSNLGLAEALRHQEMKGNLAFIGIRHEGAAAFACSGYAKLTGKPAACLSIAGPGATNLLTGLWDAKVDRAPVLALTGQVNTQVFGPGAFQEIDLASAFSAVSAFSQTVLQNSSHAELMTLAMKNAIVKRDVSHLIFPDEVQVQVADEGAKPSGPKGRIAADTITPPTASVKAACNLIGKAKRPLIIVGYGAREAMGPVIKLAERLKCPVVTTFKAKGQISDKHPHAAGVLGRSGTPIASWFMNEADLLMVFGASFSNHTGIEPSKPIIQVDFEQMALGKFHPVEAPVWGEVGVTAGLFLKGLGKKKALDQRAELADRWKMWRREKASRRKEDRGKGLNSATVFHALSKLAPKNAVIAVDVGNNTYSFGRYFECSEQRVLMSGYLGSIGFGFPAAMGAWAATQADKNHKGRPVLSISGDGGFGQYMGEVTTAVKYRMNITHILLNNFELGKISKEQIAGHWQVWQTSLHNPSFAAFAKICGAFGVKVTKPDQLEAAIKAALKYDGPAIVEIMTDGELI
ncbi:MAG: thiamine pyrophosphate-binding protein [Alphaproteobacteria bacterium]|nr:MAG: thiamine pyrophosphate-binding protein [Alphaproteobacteria bacterium]